MTQSTVVLFDLIKKVYIIGYELFFISKMKKNRQILNAYYPVCIRVLLVISCGTINIIIQFVSKVCKFQPQTSILQFYTSNIMHRKWQLMCENGVLIKKYQGIFKEDTTCIYCIHGYFRPFTFENDPPPLPTSWICPNKVNSVLL